MNPHETQVGGDHYSKMKIQPIDFIEDNGLSFIEGNIIKYVARHRQKNGKEDLLKARHYIDLAIEKYYKPQKKLEKMKHTLTFRISKNGIIYHHDNEKQSLIDTPIGTKDEIGYISTGEHFENMPDYLWLIKKILDLAYEKSGGKLSESDCLKIILCARAIAHNSECADCNSLSELYKHFGGKGNLDKQ